MSINKTALIESGLDEIVERFGTIQDTDGTGTLDLMIAYKNLKNIYINELEAPFQTSLNTYNANEPIWLSTHDMHAGVFFKWRMYDGSAGAGTQLGEYVSEKGTSQLLGRIASFEDHFDYSSTNNLVGRPWHGIVAPPKVVHFNNNDLFYRFEELIYTSSISGYADYPMAALMIIPVYNSSSTVTYTKAFDAWTSCYSGGYAFRGVDSFNLGGIKDADAADAQYNDITYTVNAREHAVTKTGYLRAEDIVIYPQSTTYIVITSPLHYRTNNNNNSYMTHEMGVGDFLNVVNRTNTHINKKAINLLMRGGAGGEMLGLWKNLG